MSNTIMLAELDEDEYLNSPLCDGTAVTLIQAVANH